MKKLLLLSSLAIGALFLMTSCGDGNNTVEMQREIDRNLIREHLQNEGLLAMADSTASGLFYVVQNEGSAEKPNATSDVSMHYRGYYLDGTQFDSSYDRGQPLEAPLSNLIRGWQEGVPFYGRGGSGILLIPSELGYGPFPPPGVRANAVLVFEIELIDFE